VNVEANVTSEYWEKLFLEIHEYAYRYEAMEVELTDSEAHRYDFANEILMHRMRVRLVEAILKAVHMTRHSALAFRNKFFVTMNEHQQRSFFHIIFNLPISKITVGEATDNSKENPAITINTTALLETLP
jgi:hypothetical protein